MKEETKSILESILKREPDEIEIKMFDIMTEMGLSKEAVHPVKFSLDFGKKCHMMGWNDFKEFSGE